MAATLMLWSCQLDSSNAATVEIPDDSTLSIKQATLILPKGADADSKAACTVWATSSSGGEEMKFALCVLRPMICENARISMLIPDGEVVKLNISGAPKGSKVNLYGYYAISRLGEESLSEDEDEYVEKHLKSLVSKDAMDKLEEGINASSGSSTESDKSEQSEQARELAKSAPKKQNKVEAKMKEPNQHSQNQKQKDKKDKKKDASNIVTEPPSVDEKMSKKQKIDKKEIDTKDKVAPLKEEKSNSDKGKSEVTAISKEKSQTKVIEPGKSALEKAAAAMSPAPVKSESATDAAPLSTGKKSRSKRKRINRND